MLVLADHLDRSVHYEVEEADVPGLTRALALLMHGDGDEEATRVLEGWESDWYATAIAALARPSRWAALLAMTPGEDVVERAEVALRRLLLRGVTFESVVAQLARNGPVPALEAIARTGMLSQFDFSDRARRARRLDRRIEWTKLAFLAAQARGHMCCAGPFLMELEDLMREQLGLSSEEEVALGWPIAEA
jgi:hypothetical protein